MTICIAVACKHNEEDFFVVSTDHMIDVGIGQFEHDIKKYQKISGKDKVTIAMIAGNALLFNELLENINGDEKFSKIRDKIFENFKRVKQETIKNHLYEKFNLDENDIKEIIKTQIPNQLIGKLVENVAKFDLDTYILLVGYENKKPKIAEINENGFNDYSHIHFHSIGSGQVQAINTLLFQKQACNNPLKMTIYNVYKAKRNAEVVTGVGKETDILLLKTNDCYELTEDDIEVLSEIYQKELEFGKNAKELNRMKIIDKL